jgi:hypothetical protein
MKALTPSNSPFSGGEPKTPPLKRAGLIHLKKRFVNLGENRESIGKVFGNLREYR